MKNCRVTIKGQYFLPHCVTSLSFERRALANSGAEHYKPQTVQLVFCPENVVLEI